MIKHLLVPLDGSHLAESALPAASFLAERLHASVTLLHLVEAHPPGTVHGERHLKTADNALVYLNEVAARAFPAGIAVEKHVHTVQVTDVPGAIAEHVAEMECDLVILCRHGQTDLHTFLFGSIAQQVIAHGKTPLLVIQPASSGAVPPFTCNRLLVGLDGNPEHETGLAVASSLAAACQADLHLLAVVHTLVTLKNEKAETGKLLPGTMMALLDESEEDMRVYLAEKVKGVAADGVAATFAVGRGDPAELIVQTAASVQADVIVLTTHGKLGMDAFWAGSVAPNVAVKSRSPLLLVPAPAN
jgi:nucleotide-binding universal stress UspA family protein